jgi:hypothetical protein
MPSIDRVLKEVQGADPVDTLKRQVGAFAQLTKVIRDAAGPRANRNQLTADEMRLMQEYVAADVRVRSQVPKGLNAYDVDHAFLEELLTRFKMDTVRATLAAQNAAYAAQHQRFVEQQQREFEAAKGRLSSAQSEAEAKAKNQQEAERCLASGRSVLDCTGAKFNQEAGGVLGLFGTTLNKAYVTSPGLYLTGTWEGVGWQLVFPSEQNFVIVGCGGLQPSAAEYTIENKTGQLTLKIAGAQPLTLAIQPSNALAIASAVEMKGVVQTGVKRGVRTFPDGHTKPISEPVYESRTARCGAGSLLLTEPAKAMGAGSYLSTLPIVQQSDKAISDSKQFVISPGLRLVGNYAAPSGLTIDFQRTSAMLACGDASLANSYSIANAGGQWQVKIQDAANPVALTIQPEGKLSGSGVAKVAGRAVGFRRTRRSTVPTSSCQRLPVVR